MDTRQYFTVIGYYPETSERYCGWLRTDTPENAVRSTLRKQPELAIVEVIAGRRKALAPGRHVQFEADR